MEKFTMNDTTIAFIGLGLIGGSLAKGIKRARPDIRIMAYMRTRSKLEQAKKDGIVDVILDGIDEQLKECDLIFLCTPVEYNAQYLSKIRSYLKPGALITDVGSTKTDIHEEILRQGLTDCFVGGHPMAGSEKTSYTYANDRLVENAYYAITPTDTVSKERVEEFTEIVQGIGAIPINISYEEHDKVVATISHLPHLIAASLVNLVKHNDSKNEYMKTMAAGGFKDITRIASSSPEMWEQICMTNNTNISDMLQKYVDSLLEIKEDLDQHKGQGIFDLISESRDYRDSIEDRNNSLISRSYNVYCNIIDESGAIATIATILATNGVSIKNIGIIHNREFEDGVLKISFYDETSADKAVEQLERHRYNVIKRK